MLDYCVRSLISRYSSAVVAFLYPGYASYKTLSQRPASEEELERWLMYWSVLGCVMAVEYTTEWVVSWCASNFPTFQWRREPELIIPTVCQDTILLSDQNPLFALPCPTANAWIFVSLRVSAPAFFPITRESNRCHIGIPQGSCLRISTRALQATLGQHLGHCRTATLRLGHP